MITTATARRRKMSIRATTALTMIAAPGAIAKAVDGSVDSRCQRRAWRSDAA